MSPDNIECDCGRPKFGAAECCGRCAFLDGQSRDARVIAALRMLDGQTQFELEAALGYVRGGLWRPLQDMLDMGRLTRVLRENDAKEFVGRGRYGGSIPMAGGASESWVYYLSAKRRAA